MPDQPVATIPAGLDLYSHSLDREQVEDGVAARRLHRYVSVPYEPTQYKVFSGFAETDFVVRGFLGMARGCQLRAVTVMASANRFAKLS